MGNFISEGWKKLSGQNQKVGMGTIGNEWDSAYGTDDSGLMGDYGWLQDQGKQMMDPYSQKNMGAYARMGQQSSEGQSQMFRNMQRMAAMQGGGASGALTQQMGDFGNKATAGTMDAFNQYLGQQYSGGAGMMSGAMANIGQLKGGRMNAMQNQRLANAQIDTNATGQGLGMLGGLGQMAFGMPPTMMMGAQEGGPVQGYQTGRMVDDPFAELDEELSSQKGTYAEDVEKDSYEQYGKRLHEGMKLFGGETDDYLPSGGYTPEHYQKTYGAQPDTAYYNNPGSYQFNFPGVKGGERAIGGPPLEADIIKQQATRAGQDAMGVFDRLDWDQDLAKRSPYAQGGPVDGSGGMLSMVMGPDGPMRVGTRMGGELVG